MSRYYSAKVDANQADIVAELRRLGAYVLLVHRLKNCCDCLIMYKGFCVAVEIKDGEKAPSQCELSAGEREFMDQWTSNGGKWALVESIKDAQGLIYSIDERLKQ